MLRRSLLAFAVLAGIIPASAARAVSIVDAIQYAPGQNTSAAAPGQIGEIVSAQIASGSAVTYTTTATAYNLLSLSLTPGAWLCQGNIITTAAGTTFASVIAAFSFTSATLPTAGTQGYSQANQGNSTGVGGVETGVFLTTLSALSTVYLVSQAAFTGTAPTMYGGASCVRLR